MTLFPLLSYFFLLAPEVNKCNCKDGKVFASAWAAGVADEFEAKIEADVSSEATGAVCVNSNGPGQSATAKVEVLNKFVKKNYA
jgi:hypothetical protein